MHYLTKADFDTVRKTWAMSKRHSASDLIVYNILRGKPVCNGFSKKVKGVHGSMYWNSAWSGLNLPIYYLLYELGANERAAKFKEEFKIKFGIDMPDDFKTKLQYKV